MYFNPQYNPSKAGISNITLLMKKPRLRIEQLVSTGSGFLKRSIWYQNPWSSITITRCQNGQHWTPKEKASMSNPPPIYSTNGECNGFSQRIITAEMTSNLKLLLFLVCVFISPSHFLILRCFDMLKWFIITVLFAQHLVRKRYQINGIKILQ